MRTTIASVHAEPHDRITVEREDRFAVLLIEGRASLTIADLSKAQVLRLQEQVAKCLDGWPSEGCTWCNQLASGTKRVPTGGLGDHEYNDEPACSSHRDVAA